MTTQAQAIQLSKDALQAARKHVDTQNKAESMLEGFGARKPRPSDDDLRLIDDAIVAIDAAAVQEAPKLCAPFPGMDIPWAEEKKAELAAALDEYEPSQPAQPPAPLPQGEQCPVLRLPDDDGDDIETNLQEALRLSYEAHANQEQPRLQGGEMFLSWEYYSGGWKDAIAKYAEKSPAPAQPVAAQPAPIALKTWPERIYLQHSEDGDVPNFADVYSAGDGITWCQDGQFDGDVEYVRADLIAPTAQLESKDAERYRAADGCCHKTVAKRCDDCPFAEQAAPVPHGFDLTPVITWLENGCDPKEAAKELRIYKGIMGSVKQAQPTPDAPYRAADGCCHKTVTTRCEDCPFVEQAAPVLDVADEREDRGIVPGKMHCARCKFALQRKTLFLKSGTVGAGDNKTEPCPNGCGPLWPMTWEQEARECYTLMDQLFERAKTAEDALAALSQPIAKDELPVMSDEEVDRIHIAACNEAYSSLERDASIVQWRRHFVRSIVLLSHQPSTESKP